MIPQLETATPVCLVSYSEIALKKGNRSYFEDFLVRNIKTALPPDAGCEVRKIHGRIVVIPKDAIYTGDLLKRISSVFGVARVALAHKTKLDIETIGAKALELTADKKFRTFAVRARRQDKKFPLNSQKINEIIGARVQKATNAGVDLTDPELTLGIEIMKDSSFAYCDFHSGPGGLPVGVSGHAACLISGGIDSPVAAWRMMKRGCRLSFIHFHSAPFTGDESKEKVEETVRILTKYQPSSKLIIVPFGEIQKKIVTNVPVKYRVVLYRRFMVRIACAIAKKIGAKVLVTGESLSQVASQTLDNIRAIEAISALPIFRPLIGYDKEEIVNEARKIGTYDISIEPHADCCSFLVPKHPVLDAKTNELDEAEKTLDINELVGIGVDNVEIKKVSNIF